LNERDREANKEREGAHLSTALINCSPAFDYVRKWFIVRLDKPISNFN